MSFNGVVGDRIVSTERRTAAARTVLRNERMSSSTATTCLTCSSLMGAFKRVASKYSRPRIQVELTQPRLRTSLRPHWRNRSFTLQSIQFMHYRDGALCSLLAIYRFTYYHAQCPPSIRRSDPVMNELASLTRNTAAPLYSLGADSLPSMFCVGHVSLRSGYLTNNSSTICVTMYPGDMVLTRTLC